MLILAGVVLNLTIGERGIFKTAQGAAQNYTNAQAIENSILDNYENEINKYIDNNTGNIDVNDKGTVLYTKFDDSKSFSNVNYEIKGNAQVEIRDNSKIGSGKLLLSRNICTKNK